MKSFILAAALMSATASVCSANTYGTKVTDRCLQGGGDSKLCRDAGTIYASNQFALGIVGLATGGPVGMHLSPYVFDQVIDQPGMWFTFGLFAWAPSWFLSWQFMRRANQIQRKVTNADKREFEELQAQNA